MPQCPFNQPTSTLLPHVAKLGVWTALERVYCYPYFLAHDVLMFFACVNGDGDQALIHAIF